MNSTRLVLLEETYTSFLIQAATLGLPMREMPIIKVKELYMSESTFFFKGELMKESNFFKVTVAAP